MKIAVDAMGGDHAPQAIVEGVALAQQDFPEVEFLLYGKEAEIKKVRGIGRPRVALLNNGTEATKGSEVTKKAYELLQNETSLNFIGNVEARELLNGVADVVVTDGFTGNAVLKSIEGTAMNMMDLLKSAILNEGIKGKMGAMLLKDGLRSLKSEMDYSKAKNNIQIAEAIRFVKKRWTILKNVSKISHGVGN